MARTTTTTEKTLDLHKLIVDGFAAKGVKAKARWAPSRNYASYLVDGENVGYVFKQTRGGVRVEPALAKGELPKAVKGFEAGKRSARFAYVGVASDAAGAARVVAALKVAAEKAAARKAAKA